jgi:hypothetical protein
MVALELADLEGRKSHALLVVLFNLTLVVLFLPQAE